MSRPALEDLWRQEAPQVLGALIRKYGDFARCEDAVQEALVAASEQWRREGVPDSPRGWLVRVASRRLIDAVRTDQARADREFRLATRNPADAFHAAAADADPDTGTDDTLQLLLLCCHPALTRASQVSLTLRAVAGLTTEQIASAFLVPTATMAQRVSRAKATLRSAEARFTEPPAAQGPDRLAAVLDVLYLVFNEGYTTSGGNQLVDLSLTHEAIRLTRGLRERLPAHMELAGLLALMLLIDARTPARTDERGDLISLEEQDRGRWNATAIHEAVAILEDILPRGDVGTFQLQAAIAAVHAEAATWEETDWRQIVELYRMLDRVAANPIVTLNLGVAVGMAHGPAEGLAVVDPLLDNPPMQHHHRAHAVRAHLLEMAGRTNEAIEGYATAARLTSSLPEQRYLNTRAAKLHGHGSGAADLQQ